MTNEVQDKIFFHYNIDTAERKELIEKGLETREITMGGPQASAASGSESPYFGLRDIRDGMKTLGLHIPFVKGFGRGYVTLVDGQEITEFLEAYGVKRADALDSRRVAARLDGDRVVGLSVYK